SPLPTTHYPLPTAAALRPPASVSVIITVHDNSAVILKTLRSVDQAVDFFATRYPRVSVEIIVVDDGSTDNSFQLIQEYTRTKPFYQLIPRHKASNPSCARNVGATASKGDLLFFLDGDDLFLPNHLYECYRVLEDPS